MSYNPELSQNILKRIRKRTEELYNQPEPTIRYPIPKQNLGIIRIAPAALRKMADNLVEKGYDENEMIEVEGMIMDLDDYEKDVFCYYI